MSLGKRRRDKKRLKARKAFEDWDTQRSKRKTVARLNRHRKRNQHRRDRIKTHEVIRKQLDELE